jgi:hypothetical protein
MFFKHEKQTSRDRGNLLVLAGKLSVMTSIHGIY